MKAFFGGMLNNKLKYIIATTYGTSLQPEL